MEYVVLGTSYQRDIIAYDMRLLSYFSKCQANSNSVLRSINKVLPCILTAGTYKFISLHRIRKLNAKDYIGTYTRYHMPMAMCGLLTFCDEFYLSPNYNTNTCVCLFRSKCYNYCDSVANQASIKLGFLRSIRNQT